MQYFITGIELVDDFGYSVSLNGNFAIGSRNQGRPGVAHIFELHDGGRGLAAKITAPDGSDDDSFGAAVAIAGNRCAVGAPGDDELGTDAGAV